VLSSAEEDGGDFLGAGSPPFVIDAGTVEPGDRLVATATDANGNTSEFSAPVDVVFLDRVFRDGLE